MHRTLRSTFALDGSQARVALGAARAVLEVDGLRPRGEALLATLARTLEITEATPTCTPAEVRAAFPDPRARRVLVDALLVPACIEGEVTLATERAVKRWARELGVESHWVDLLGAMRRRGVLSVKQALGRRSPDARRILRRTWDEEGLAGVWMVIRFLLGVYRDPALAARFRGLGTLATGTVGRTFFDHLTANGLSFPGERGGMPERMVHHDLMHVVNEYGTDPAGECELAGFYAGCAEGDAFTFIVIVLTTFQLGMRVSPSIVTPARGAFDPERVLRAFLRGRYVRVDVMGRWDYWALMELPLGEARARLGIEPSAVEGNEVVTTAS